MAKRAKRKKVESEPREMTRKQIALSRRERGAQLTVRVSLGAVAVLVVVVLVFGALRSVPLNPEQPITVINGMPITVQYFRKNIRLGYYLSSQRAASDPQAPLVNGDLVAENTLDRLISDELLRQLAVEHGVTASKQEVDQFIKEAFGFGDPNAASALFDQSESDEEEATPTITPTFVYTLTPSPTVEGAEEDGEAESPAVDATPEAEEQSAAEIEQSEMDLDAQYAIVYEERILEWSDASGLSEAEIREQLFELEVIRNKLVDIVQLDVAETQVQLQLGQILVETAEEAEQLLAEIEAGAEFELLAAEHSLDTITAYRGGNLGWMSRTLLDSSIVSEFADELFKLEDGEIGGPYASEQGYRLLKVYARGDVELNPLVVSQQRRQAFELFLTSLRSNSEIDTNDNWRRFVPVLQP